MDKLTGLTRAYKIQGKDSTGWHDYVSSYEERFSIKSEAVQRCNFRATLNEKAHSFTELRVVIA